MTFSSLLAGRPVFLILLALDTMGSLKTTDIKKITGLSWNGIIRTLKLLREKDIVKLKSLRSENNTKIYTLQRERAVAYSTHLLLSKDSKSWRIISRRNAIQATRMLYGLSWMVLYSKMISPTLKTLEARDGHLNKTFPRDLLEAELQIQKDGKWMKIKIDDLPYLEGREILNNWFLGRYCNACLQTGWIHKVIVDGDVRWCNNCGKDDPVPLSVFGSAKDPTLDSRRLQVAREQWGLFRRNMKV